QAIYVLGALMGISGIAIMVAYALLTGEQDETE
ncbi:unnamed protein product, partial [marine sediment metagenome]